ncbi:MAG: glycoside hydrolase family 9 protein [Chloroherpetonaceae bacterium]|nr:glycoside hydrolase family 9 protein [Chthonomonadaceae bacterium]MDW8208999.1 glycoside hydrolase family 9 protein [Chloroherpetonaceae bacterium]
MFARTVLQTGMVLLGMSAVSARAADLVALQPLTERILMVHVKDGHVEHHRRGQPRTQEKVIADPLDTVAAMRLQAWLLRSENDPAYRTARAPVRVGRKSKGTEFAWFMDRWENNRVVNTRPDHVKEHWIYLTLPAPLQPGRTYRLDTGSLLKNGRIWTLTYDPARSRSEAVHVNTLGYVPQAPQKFAYVYHWMGDQGGLDVRPFVGKTFALVEVATGKRVFTGRVVFRMPATQQETGHLSDTPNGNFLGADVAECDFSAFSRPGRYVVSVEGIGCSWPFRIDPDVYRPAFVATMRALYHNRSGIALTLPYTEFTRPAPHHVRKTPGFAGKLRYTRLRYSEWGSEGGDPKRLMAESPGALRETWGWYQDAGDWDSYDAHLRVAQELLLVYAMAPQNFRDGELNIPESGNGIPDILDEAAWLPRFCHRLRQELRARGWGTGGIGLRVAGDAFGSDEKTLADGQKVGQGSWEDTDRIWMVSGEDPWSTYYYAGVAANLARFIPRDPEGVNWAREARESYAWAQANTRPGDEEREDHRLRGLRAYAAASLFALTGEKVYEEQLARDTAWFKPDTLLTNETLLAGPAVYALQGRGDAQLRSRMRRHILLTADETLIRTPARRALRWGGNFYFPMLVGHQTTPWVLEGAVAYTLTRSSEPERARQYLAALYTTCDYFLGTNALNQTWITGVGPRYPKEIFHMDAWYNGKGRFHPGLIPYGPWRKEKDFGQGPWDVDWANSTVYPVIDRWPGNERWFSNRCSPLTSEFTIHQNIGPAAAIYGFLCAGQRVARRPGQ